MYFLLSEIVLFKGTCCVRFRGCTTVQRTFIWPRHPPASCPRPRLLSVENADAWRTLVFGEGDLGAT